MTAAARVLADVAPAVGGALSPLHFRYFCDKLAASFCPRFYETIFRCAAGVDEAQRRLTQGGFIADSESGALDHGQRACLQFACQGLSGLV